MTKATMPEPFGWLLDCLPGGGLAFQRGRPSEIQTLVNSTCAVFTTTQAEAYADARVREALEEAAKICWEMQSAPEFGKDDKDHWLAIAERRILALIPPTE